MSILNRLLFATDFSAGGRRAEVYAAFLAHHYGASLDLLHVVEWYPGMDPDWPVNSLYVEQHAQETDQRLIEVARRLRGTQVTVTRQSRLGVPSEHICAVAEELHADLIVQGTHGRTGLDHVLLGSTAERVVTMAPCPVLTVRYLGPTAPSEATSQISLEHIVVPVDFSECSHDALEYAVHLGKQCGASIQVLHVLEPLAYGLDFTLRHEPNRSRQEAEARLSKLEAAIRSVGVRVETAMRGALPTDSILQFTQDQTTDLIVMGTHGRRGVSHFLKGSVAEYVLRHATCPVVTVKSLKMAGLQRFIPTGAHT